MPVSRTLFAAAAFTAASTLLPSPTAGAADPRAAAFERTEQRADCADYRPLRKPLFGDLHVHTSYSFDAYISSMRRDPWDAYRYAKGEPIILPDPLFTRSVLENRVHLVVVAIPVVAEPDRRLGPGDLAAQSEPA